MCRHRSPEPKMPRPPERLRMLAPVVTALLIAAAPSVAAEPSGAETEARASVQRTVDEVLALLGDAELSAEQKKDRVEALADERFDFSLIARLVAARNWRKFNEAQRPEFIRLFRRHLSASYRDGLDRYSGQTVTLTGSRLEANGDVTVRTTIESGGLSDVLQIDYRMRKRGDRWLGIDLIIEGVSLLQNFRSQIQEIVSRRGVDAVLESLREKAAGESAALDPGLGS